MTLKVHILHLGSISWLYLAGSAGRLGLQRGLFHQATRTVQSARRPQPAQLFNRGVEVQALQLGAWGTRMSLLEFGDPTVLLRWKRSALQSSVACCQCRSGRLVAVKWQWPPGGG